MKYILILLVSTLLFSTSCKTTSPEELDKEDILDILDSIQTNFNFDDLEGIMQNYHQSFNHDGYDYDSESIRWEIRLNDHDELILSDIDILINGDFATASFVMNLDNISSNEPSDDNGDISYFYRELGNWSLCGDNFIVLP